MSPIPASFLPTLGLWPERIYRLPTPAGHPQRPNSTEALARDGWYRAGDFVRRVPRISRAPGPADPATGKLLRRVLRDQAAQG
jgi:hypothetical protein